MRNIKLTIAYEGTRYAGWQFQKNATSIQEVIETALARITGSKVTLIGSGRTDAGVHARAQVANFKTHSKIPIKNLQMALNTNLPKDIVVTHIAGVKIKFNAQHDAMSKLYRYTVVNNNFVDPFMRRFAAKVFFRLNIKDMRKAAAFLVARHDFRSFQATDGEERDAVRTIKHIKISREADLIYVDIEADGFVYNMARNIVGTLVEVGRGKFSVSSVKDILKRKNRRFSGPTMPAKGLCLVNVRY